MSEVLVDSREKNYATICEYLTEYLPEGVTFNVPSGGLDHGADYIIRNESEIAIQRKEIGDFVSTLGDSDRNLKKTLYKLRENYEHSCLLIEGDWKMAGSHLALRRGRKLHQTGVTFSSFHNLLLSAQLRGTFVVRTASLKETSMMLANWHSYLDGSISPSVQVADPREIFCLMPGIGSKKSQEISDFFGSPYLALLSFPNWGEVPGIGPKTISECEKWLKSEGDKQ